MRRSLVEGSVLVDIAAGTEQPNPIRSGTMLRPESPILRRSLSITKATRAMYPLSSSIERKKNMTTIIGTNDTTVPTPGFAVRGNVFSRSSDVLARVFTAWRGHAEFGGNVWESGGEPLCRFHGRPRGGLRHLYPDRLDRIHRDDRGISVLARKIRRDRAYGNACRADKDECVRLKERRTGPF